MDHTQIKLLRIRPQLEGIVNLEMIKTPPFVQFVFHNIALRYYNIKEDFQISFKKLKSSIDLMFTSMKDISPPSNIVPSPRNSDINMADTETDADKSERDEIQSFDIREVFSLELESEREESVEDRSDTRRVRSIYSELNDLHYSWLSFVSQVNTFGQVIPTLSLEHRLLLTSLALQHSVSLIKPT